MKNRDEDHLIKVLWISFGAIVITYVLLMASINMIAEALNGL